MKKTPKLAAVQMASGPNVDANLLEAERLIRDAAAAGAGLVVLPENFAFMGKRIQDVIPLAEADGEGPLQAFLARAAAKMDGRLVAVGQRDSGAPSARPPTPRTGCVPPAWSLTSVAAAWRATTRSTSST